MRFWIISILFITVCMTGCETTNTRDYGSDINADSPKVLVYGFEEGKLYKYKIIDVVEYSRPFKPNDFDTTIYQLFITVTLIESESINIKAIVSYENRTVESFFSMDKSGQLLPVYDSYVAEVDAKYDNFPTFYPSSFIVRLPVKAIGLEDVRNVYSYSYGSKRSIMTHNCDVQIFDATYNENRLGQMIKAHDNMTYYTQRVNGWEKSSSDYRTELYFYSGELSKLYARKRLNQIQSIIPTNIHTAYISRSYDINEKLKLELKSEITFILEDITDVRSILKQLANRTKQK